MPERLDAMQLLDTIRRFLRAHDLVRPATRVVVALSGGSDSMALAHLLRELDEAGDLRVVGLAHFNHQLRPDASSDEQFCREVAESFGWPIFIEREDVAARARRDRRSMEDAARTARHEFFARARAHFTADVVALGHTRDDQAETFLLRLSRGAGLRGLAAMHPLNGSIIRPVLACGRSELRAYLAARGVAFVEDASNADVSIPRNRVRAELVPLLKERFNPRIVEVLAKEAEMARDAWAWMESAADELAATLAHTSTDGQKAHVWTFDVAALQAVPVALRRLVLWKAMTDVAAGRPISFDHVEAALGLLDGADGAASDAPGQRLERLGLQLVLKGRASGASGRLPPPPVNLFSYPLSIPGEVHLREAGSVVSAETPSPGTSGPELEAAIGNVAVAVVRRDLQGGQWAVRNRRPGDRFRPVGFPGRKKLQDFFVDKKVARQHRDTVPLVVDDQDRIVWVAGHGIDEAFRVTDATQAVIILRLKVVGGFA